MPSVVVESVLLDCLFSVWCFVDHSLFFCLFGHCVVSPYSIYRFWLALWYLQTLLIITLTWKFFNLLTERIWCRLFQKRVLCTKLDIYVFYLWNQRTANVFVDCVWNCKVILELIKFLSRKLPLFICCAWLNGNALFSHTIIVRLSTRWHQNES
jgi:hypothetical protein